MGKLEETYIEFQKFTNWGHNQYEAAERAVTDIFKSKPPYINKDNYGDASHVFFENQVLFFNGQIYSKNK